jgi:hypothetical protein
MNAQMRDQKRDVCSDATEVFRPNMALLEALNRVAKEVEVQGPYERKQLEAFYKAT